MYDYVPASYFDRPKRGFAVPLGTWLKTDLKYLIDQYLSSSLLEECGLVHPHIVEQLKSDFFGGNDYLYNRLWTLILLHKWFTEE